jgi:hypothetical protein
VPSLSFFREKTTRNEFGQTEARVWAAKALRSGAGVAGSGAEANGSGAGTPGMEARALVWAAHGKEPWSSRVSHRN